jgi:RimJ/RimL family protein N-acetyltransferase
MSEAAPAVRHEPRVSRGLGEKLIQPNQAQVLRFCAADPIERVFLEDVARRGLGRFAAVAKGADLVALCHLGANLVPSGRDCGVFAGIASRTSARMLIGEAGAVTELWEAARDRLPPAREDRPRQPVFVIEAPPPPGRTGLRAARVDDLELLLPACAAAHREELGIDPLRHDPDGFRWRTRAQIDEGRSWLWEEDGVIHFKAEASAWTPHAVQLQQVWTDPVSRGHGYASRALADLLRILLGGVPAVCLFVRAENVSAIRLYRRVGMRHTIDYRSVLL